MITISRPKQKVSGYPWKLMEWQKDEESLGEAFLEFESKPKYAVKVKCTKSKWQGGQYSIFTRGDFINRDYDFHKQEGI